MRLFKWKLFGVISAPLLGLIVILSLLIPVLINAQSASAAAGNVTKETDGVEIFRAVKYYHGIEFCASKDGFKKEIGGDDISGGPQKWVHYAQNKDMTIGTGIDKWGDKNGRTNCTGDGDGQNWMDDALQLFGIDPSGGEASLKKLGYNCSIINGSKTCKKDDINNTIMDVIKNSAYAKGTPLGDTSSSLYKVAAYAGAFKAFQVSCAGKKGGNTGLVSISVVENGQIKKQDWSQNGENPQAGVDPLVTTSANSDSCSSTIVNVINNNAEAYQVWSNEATCRTTYPDLASDANKVTWCARGRANATNTLYCVTATSSDANRNACFTGAGHPKDGSGKTAGELCIAMAYANSELEACIKGALNKANANYCNSTYPAPDNLSTSGNLPNDANKAKREACTEGAKLKVSGGGVVPGTDQAITPADGDPQTTTCVVDSVGWIVCPIVGFASTMSDVLYGWISTYLKVQPLNVDISSDNNTMYVAWNIMRNIANVAFVIVFIIIIYSQLTGMGVSNYGVKKALPRLIVAAILVNLSYWIAAAAVDISNIIGNNLYNLLKNLPLGNVAGESIGWEAIGTWLLAGGTATGLVIAGAAVTAGAAWGSVGLVALYVLIPIIIAVVLALVLAFVVLALRQALIIIMIVVAPLAFVAMLLPNTEKFFKMWQKSLMTLLIFYPLFSLLFGGAYVAGMIIIGSAGSGESPAMTVIIGMAVTTLPLFLTPMLIKFSSGIMGQVASGLNGKFKNNPLSKAMKNLRNRKASLAMGETLGRNSRNPFNRGYRFLQNNRQADEKRKENIAKSNKASYLETDRAARLEHIGEETGERIKTAEAEHKEAFERHVTNTPNLMRQRQRQDAASRSTATSGQLQKEHIESNLSMTSRMMDQQKADSELRTQGVVDQQKLDIERNQEANPELRNVRLQNAGVTKDLSAIEKDRQRVVTQAGTIGGGMELAGQGYDPSSIQRIQTAQAATADSELKIAHATGETELETTIRQNTDQELRNIKLTTEAARRDKGAADKEFEQVITEATSTAGGELLINRGYDADAIGRLQDSQIDTAVATAATASAQRVQQEEFTSAIRAGEVLPNGQSIPQAMAGIDTTHGEALVTAQAIETQRKARESNVSAFTIQHRDAGRSTQELFDLSQNTAYTPEEREAAGRAVVDSGNIDIIKPYVEYLSTALDSAQTPEQRIAIQDLQKAAGERIASSPGKPIGIGPGEIEALRNGEYRTPAVSLAKGGPLTQAQAQALASTDLIQTYNVVVDKGVSAEGWASMDKNDIGTIATLAGTDGLIPPQRTETLMASIKTALTDPRISVRIKERETDLLRKLYTEQLGGNPNDLLPRR